MDNNTNFYLSDMEDDCELYGMVEIDQLRSVWKARRFSILAHKSIVSSGLLPSIFDWQLIWQLMPAEQAHAEMMLQQRINDLELMNSLTTSLQHIYILPEIGIDVDVMRGRPSYNVFVQDDGSIMVKERRSLYVHVFATETRVAAGQEYLMDTLSLLAMQQTTNQQDSQITDTENTLLYTDGTIKEPTQLTNSQDPSGSEEMTEPNITSSNDVEHSEEEEEEEYDAPTNEGMNRIEELNNIRDRRILSLFLRFCDWFCQIVSRLRQ
ncbi:uncharacterized protein LOC6565684 [Drosophila grimshawi]|uniref:GH24278 n=1 Tax=Drosophila grimshawi TaxID=7222 RepID=B4JMS2_DROGR|nr:uncharacterized protein LOC6565684 [Drosophila grimshawi]XP_032594735.1 uncharacterized protein LOC6565684 [Drosophila grimshawi]EDV92015.1 GH24278 [Drosophila grimshawi]